MTVAELLADCHARHIDLQAHGGQLDVDAPAGELTPDLIAPLTAHKGELLALLADGAEPVTVPQGDVAPAVDALQRQDDAPQDKNGDGPRTQPQDSDAAGWIERETADGWELVRADVADDEVIDLQPCPVCGGLEIWQDVAGGWHCPACSPPSPRSAVLRELAQRIQKRYRTAPQDDTRQTTLDDRR